jgi:hypothetical protein
MTTAYHPSADGQAEKSNDTIKVALRCMLIGQYEENWPSIIPETELALNTLVNTNTGYSPFEVVFGWQPV